ncbi:MAG: response regulator, partial [Pseudomonadota bacterium]
RAIVIALPVAATAVLLVSAVLLELARQRQFARRAVGLVATANEQLDSRSTLPLEARINRILREAAEYLDASDTALYVRAANSSLFRRSYRHARDQASLPDAMLSKQLRSLGGHDASVGTIVREQQQGTPKTLSSTNRIVAVRRPGADGGEVVLAAEWQLTDAAAPDAAAALLRLLLPACSAALSESRAVADRQLAQDRFRLVMQGVPDAVCLILPDGTVLAANPAFETLTGNEREAWRGRRLGELELFDAETLDGALAAATVGGPVHRTTVLRKESGETTSCDIHVLQLVGGEDPQVLLVARESTAETDRQLQQQNLERQFSQAQRMEAIGQLTQGVAHDFNNILGSIMGYTSLARMQGPVREDEKLSGYLSEIETAGKRATLLIQQMLTFSRRGRSNPESVSVSEVLGRVADLMPSLLPDGIIARTEISQNLPRLVVDVAQFEQAVISLAVNARDALGSRGTITLGARRFSAAVATCSSCRKPIGGDGVAIFVADTGTGIAPEVMDRLFEPFFTTKEVGRGTGLGLSGVHGFVHNNEGHVLVTSEPGIGSEFCLVLPAEVETARAPASPGKLPAPTAERKPHVLLVDDQQSLASLMKQVLETRNFRVTAETDGIAARDLFTSAPESFDAVVTDRFMPGLDGLALARHVRAARPGIPVVLCTGVNASHSDADIADAGICRVFRKPLRVMEFAQELEAMLLTAEPEAQES